jgi:hypothetical protein
MTRRAWLAILALPLAAACATARAPATGALKLIDLTPDIADILDRTATLPDAERVAAFKAHFAPILPGFYAHERFGLAAPGPYDQRLLAGIGRFPEEKAGIGEVSRRFALMLAPAQASFEREFGPMNDYPPIYLVDSFGEFDGGTRSLPGGTFLIFGADMIARLHLGHDIRPFFHHELFHLYHGRSFQECDRIWCSLWAEGLAVYVAARLNPRATDAELLLTVPEPLREAVDRDRREAVCSVVARLDSTASEDMRALFSSGRLNERLPPRFGYYVGYLAAAEAAKTGSLRKLAGMGNAEVRPLLEASLRSLARCPGSNPAARPG